VLLVESGSRYVFDNLLPGLYEIYPNMRLDLVTCYAGLPEGFREDRGQVYRVTDYPGREGRKRLYAELARKNYTAGGIICSGEPIMTKWKWMLVARIPAKFHVFNENGDYFWLDYTQWSTIKHFILFRAGLAGAGAVRLLATLAAFPLTLLYLLIFAGWTHLRRDLRLRSR